MHTYLETEFLCAFSILKSMGFMVFVFIYLYVCFIFWSGGIEAGSHCHLAHGSLPASTSWVLSYTCVGFWFVYLCFGSLGWPWTHYLAKDDFERSSCSLFGLHMACAILLDFFLYLGLFKIFPKTATNPQVQYFLDWEGHVGMLLKGICRVAQLVCQT